MNSPIPTRARRSPIGVLRSLARRRRIASGIVALLVIVGIVVAVTDPFGSSDPSSTGVTDNEYPTSTTTVTAQTLSSQTQQSATLGYAGSYTVSIPTGLPASTITQDRSTAEAAETAVAEATAALASAEATAKPSNASALLAAQQTVSNDETALVQAKAQLASDEQLGCPADSSATVGTASTGSSPSSSSPTSDSSTPSTSSSTPSSSSSSPITSGSGATKANLSSAVIGSSANLTDQADQSDVVLTADVSLPPTASTGSASGTGTTSATVSGTVNPNGTDTSYAFDYGTTSSFGSTTPSLEAGTGTSAVSVTANLSGLKPDTTYDFVLVATSALGTVTGGAETFQTAESSCVAEQIVVTADAAALSEAKDALQVDEVGENSSVTAAEQALTDNEATASEDEQALSTDGAQATNPGTTFTDLPAVGVVLRRGQSVYSLNNEPVPLFYGTVTPYRALSLGVTPGPDVKQFEQNLIALGFEQGAASNEFSSATEAAVKAWQASLGEPESGVVALGDDVVEPGPIDVASLTATAGSAVAGGTAVLTATSTTPVVTIDLDPSLQSDVKVGDPVTITLPNNSTTPGVISSVGTVATTPSSSGGSAASSSSSSPTITVLVTLSNPKAAGGLNQASVNVSITNASVKDVLAAPVDALLALASGGYALEEIGPDGVHHLVAVTVGLFDDQSGLVQVSGSGLEAGRKIVVPNL